MTCYAAGSRLPLQLLCGDRQDLHHVLENRDVLRVRPVSEHELAPQPENRRRVVVTRRDLVAGPVFEAQVAGNGDPGEQAGTFCPRLDHSNALILFRYRPMAGRETGVCEGFRAWNDRCRAPPCRPRGPVAQTGGLLFQPSCAPSSKPSAEAIE